MKIRYNLYYSDNTFIKDNDLVPLGFTGIVRSIEIQGEWHYLNGKFHRKDGPAANCSGIKEWYIRGKLHRLDGPAIEREWVPNPTQHVFYINGKQIHCGNTETFILLVDIMKLKGML